MSGAAKHTPGPQMKLWHLNAKSGHRLWSPWYDKAFGFVVLAPDEQSAREMASKECGDEGREAWLSPDNSACIELTTNGEAAIILRDFASA